MSKRIAAAAGCLVLAIVSGIAAAALGDIEMYRNFFLNEQRLDYHNPFWYISLVMLALFFVFGKSALKYMKGKSEHEAAVSSYRSMPVRIVLAAILLVFANDTMRILIENIIFHNNRGFYSSTLFVLDWFLSLLFSSALIALVIGVIRTITGRNGDIDDDEKNRLLRPVKQTAMISGILIAVIYGAGTIMAAGARSDLFVWWLICTVAAACFSVVMAIMLKKNGKGANKAVAVQATVETAAVNNDGAADTPAGQEADIPAVQTETEASAPEKPAVQETVIQDIKQCPNCKILYSEGEETCPLCGAKLIKLDNA